MKAAVIFLLMGICLFPVKTIAECIKGDCVNGQGIMTYPDGSKYEGQWKDEKRNGPGTMSFPDGGRLAGQWKDGNFSGQGTMVYHYGTYEGSWKDGMKSGQGTMTFFDGSKYEGHWKDDNMDGQGRMTYPDNSQYDGHWKNGRKSGQGTYSYSGGAKYVGQWLDDKKNGHGTYATPDNYTYVGQFKDGKTCGHGTMTFPDGSKYDGHWEGDMRSGLGTMTYPDGSKYEGHWEDDKINGQGTYTYADGGKYVGKWKDGRKNGHGTYIAPDNHTYVGLFKDGRPEGQGTLIFPDGSKHNVNWKGGKLVKNLKSYDGHKPSLEKMAESASSESKVKNKTVASLQAIKESGTPIEPGIYPYTIHVSSYQDKNKANKAAMELIQKGLPAFVCPAQIPGKGEYHRIFIGYYSTLDETRTAASKLKGQKDLYPLETKMPYAVLVGVFDSGEERTKLETDLRSKAYLAYSIPDPVDNSKSSLLIGAYRTKEEAAGLAKRLHQEGFMAKVVKR